MNIKTIMISTLFLSWLGFSLTSISNAQYYVRSQTFNRSVGLNREMNANAEQMGLQYVNLKRENAAIRTQEHTFRAQNGGYLTAGEAFQINTEENTVQNQINSQMNTVTSQPW